MAKERGMTHIRATGYYRPHEAAELVGLAPARVRRYLKVGLIRVAATDRGEPLLGALELERLRKIRRLTTDLGLNPSGVEVVLRLLDEIEMLRSEVERSRRTAATRVPPARFGPMLLEDTSGKDAER
jgi:DNA-binding transcriptional MerR regulator